MARKIANRKSAEQRQAEAEKLHGSIAEQVEELRNSDKWAEFLTFAQHFRTYSINNLLLILSQRPEATHVAGYRSWQNLGRQVTKGQKGLRIFGGRDITVTEEDEKTGEEKQRKVTRFFPVSVFDISQTEPMEGMEPVGSPVQSLTGDDPQGITATVTDWLTGKGWTVDIEPIPGAANGLTMPDESRVIIDAGLSPAQQAKTALHEAAHVMMHAHEDISEYVAHRGTKETEAESVAYVVAGILGLDTSGYSIGYVATWTMDDTAEVIRDTAGRVLKTARELTTAITEEQPLQALAA